MRRRLGIARALVNDPAVMFLDEPTLGLDPAGRFQVLDIVRKLAERRGATVILSTHMLAEVEEICSKVVILNRGKVRASGSVAEVIRTAMVEPIRAATCAGRAGRAGPKRARRASPGFSVVSVGWAAGRAQDCSPWVTQVLSGRSPTVMNTALVAVADAGVPVLAFEVEGARLSDAFLKMTGGVF